MKTNVTQPTRRKPRFHLLNSPSRLKKLSQSVMVGLLSASMLLPYVGALAQPLLNGPAIAGERGRNALPADISYQDISHLLDAASDMTLESSVVSDVKLPNAEYVESHIDMQLKAPGGEIKLERSWVNGRWYLNTSWANLRFVADPLDNSVLVIDRAGTLFERSGNTALYSAGKVHIKKTDDGWRWYNRDGDWITYDLQGRLTGYGDRNGNDVAFVLDAQGRRMAVQDARGETVYSFEYNSRELLSRVTDNTGRSVSYEWQGDRLVGVTDLSGNLWQYRYNSDGQITERHEPDGGVVRIGYSYSMPTAKPAMVSGINAGAVEQNAVVNSNQVQSDSKIARVGRLTDKAGAVTIYQSEYNKSTQRYTISIDEPSGRKIVNLFDSLGQLISTKMNGVLYVSIQRDGDKEIRTTDVRGLTTTVRYDVDKRPIQVIHTDGSSEFFTYDNNLNKMVRHVDAMGIVTVWQYDSSGNVLKQTRAQGRPEQYVVDVRYDSRGQPIEISEGHGEQTSSITLAYDNAGNLTEYTDGEGHTYTYQYAPDGQVTALITPLGKEWRYGYDQAGQIISVTDPLGQVMQYGYNPVGQLKEITDPLGNVTRYQQALSQNVWILSETNALGEVQRIIQDVSNNRIQAISASGLTQTLGYNLDGYLTDLRDTTGHLTTLEYGAPGSVEAKRVTTVNYPTFKETYTYNRSGPVTETKRFLDQNTALSTRSSYNANGQLVSITYPAELTSLYEYDAFGSVLKATDPSGATTRLGYDSVGSLNEVTDANGNVHRYVYDKNASVIEEVLPTGESLHYRYNADGLLTQYLDAAGNARAYSYDDSSRLINETLTAAGTTDPQQTISYHYNAAGGLINMVQTGNSNSRFAYTLDVLGRKTEEKVTYGQGNQAFTLTLKYGYDADGHLAQLTYPDGSQVSYSRDKGLLKQTVLANDEKIDWQDHKWFAPTKISFPGAEQTIEYDALLRPVDIKVNKGNSQLMQRGYSYTTAGNIAQKTSEDGEFNYEYDRADRLTQAFPSQELRDQGLPIESYAYDGVGNRVGSSHQPGEWQYGVDNRLLQMGDGDDLTQFSYTANGHIATETTASGVREYSYDASDRLVSVQNNGVEVARYQHDPFGRRISKTLNGETTWYLYSDEGLIAELDGTGKMLVAYGWQPDTMFGTAPLWQANIAPGQTLQTAPVHYLYTDHLGTPVMAVNAKGQVTWKGQHEAFGKVLESEGNQIVMNLRFPGQYYDAETDSHYNYMRDYNPELGRYQQRDPIGLAGGINSFGYAYGNPLSYMDNTGEIPILPFLIAGGYSVLAGYLINKVFGDGCYDWDDALFDFFAGMAGLAILSKLKKGKDVANFLKSEKGAVPLSAGKGAANTTTGNAASGLEPTLKNVDPKNLIGRQNKNEMSGSKIKGLVKDMKANGFDPKYPIDVAAVNGKMIIIDGHHRAAAAARAGLKNIPTNMHNVTTAQGNQLLIEAAEAYSRY